MGVVVGGIIAGASARSSQQTQIAASVWSQRMKAHQEAFSLWGRCITLVHSEENEQLTNLREAREWWNNNCLYLSEEAREQFPKMIERVRAHRGLVEEGRGRRDAAMTEAVRENFRQIRETGRVIAKGAGGHLSDRLLEELSQVPPERS